MTKLSITLTVVALSVTFGSAHAYSFEPSSRPVTQIAAPVPQFATDGEVCTVKITPELARMLALPEG